MKWLSELVKFLELPIKIILFIALLSGILFFLPSNIREYLLLTDFYQIAGTWIGLIFLFSVSYTLFLLACKIFEVIHKFINKKSKEKEIREKLQSLSSKEILVLREFYIQGSDVITAIYSDQAVSSLIRKGIVSIAQQPTEGYIFGIPVNIIINTYAKQFIDYGLLKMPENPTPEEIKNIMSKRPTFVESVEYIQDMKDRIIDPFKKYRT